MMNIAGAVSWMLAAERAWLHCVARPIATLNAMLAEASDRERLSQAVKIGVPSFVICLVVSFPILDLYGLAWTNIGFYFSYWLTTLLSLAASAFIAHRILIAAKLKSEFVRTLVMSATLVFAYFPIIALMFLPNTIPLLDAIRTVKDQDLPLAAAAPAILQNLMHGSANSIGLVSQSMSLVAQISWFGCLAVFAESASQWYGNNRFQTYSAIAAAVILGGVLTALLVMPIQFLAIYEFV